MGSSVAGAGSLWGLGGGGNPSPGLFSIWGGWRVFGCITLMVASSICLFDCPVSGLSGPSDGLAPPPIIQDHPSSRTSLPRLQGPSGRGRSHGRRSGRSGRGQRWGAVTLRPVPWKDADRPGCEPTRRRRARTAEAEAEALHGEGAGARGPQRTRGRLASVAELLWQELGLGPRPFLS